MNEALLILGAACIVFNGIALIGKFGMFMGWW